MNTYFALHITIYPAVKKPDAMNKNSHDVTSDNAGSSDDEGDESALLSENANLWNMCFPTGFIHETKSIMQVAWGMVRVIGVV